MPHTEPSNLNADADSWATVVFQAGYISNIFFLHLGLRQFDELKFVQEIQKMRASGGRGASF